MKNIKRVGIIGATGFIGSEITLKIQKKGIPLYLCSKNGGIVYEIKCDSIDVTNSSSVNDWISENKIDALFYLSSIIPKSFENADWKLFNENIKMHKSILEVWKEKKFHLLYASTCSVYTPLTPLPWSESTAVMPNNFYSLSKFVGELLFYKEFQKERLPLTIMRINAPYGVNNRIKTVVNIFMERALSGENLIVYGSGTREQDFIYVKDVARAFWLAYQKQKPGIYNIASGKTVTMRELAELIVSLTHSKSRIVYSGSEDPQEKVKVSIDVSKAQSELGFIPEFSLSNGLLDCIHEYQQITTGR